MTHDLTSPDTDSHPDSNPTIVLLDPTSPDGEAALDRLPASVRHVTLVVLLSGPCSNALREFSIAEDLSLSEAGWSYLDQVAERLRPLDVEQIVATGPDAALELATIGAERAAREILVPPSAARRDRALLRKLQRWTAVPVVVTEMAAA